jgi:hypothetical protein
MRESDTRVLLLGRRHAEGNFTGSRGEVIYTTAAGLTKYSPLADWTHEEVLALVHYKHLSLPPNYGWVRGFRVGTGPWAKRGVVSHDQGWTEIATIDRTIITAAAALIDSAREWLDDE